MLALRAWVAGLAAVLRLVAIAALTGCLMIATPAAAMQAGGVCVSVTDTTGEALPGSTVQLMSVSETRVEMTDEQGRHCFDDLPAGDYQLTTTYGSAIAQRMIRVTSGQRLEAATQLNLSELQEG